MDGDEGSQNLQDSNASMFLIEDLEARLAEASKSAPNPQEATEVTDKILVDIDKSPAETTATTPTAAASPTDKIPTPQEEAPTFTKPKDDGIQVVVLEGTDDGQQALGDVSFAGSHAGGPGDESFSGRDERSFRSQRRDDYPQDYYREGDSRDQYSNSHRGPRRSDYDPSYSSGPSGYGSSGYGRGREQDKRYRQDDYGHPHRDRNESYDDGYYDYRDRGTDRGYQPNSARGNKNYYGDPRDVYPEHKNRGYRDERPQDHYNSQYYDDDYGKNGPGYSSSRRNDDSRNYGSRHNDSRHYDERGYDDSKNYGRGDGGGRYAGGPHRDEYDDRYPPGYGQGAPRGKPGGHRGGR